MSRQSVSALMLAVISVVMFLAVAPHFSERREQRRRQWNAKLLRECDPWLAARAESVICDLDRDGFKPRIHQAWRSPSQQLRAFEAGVSEVRTGFHNLVGPSGEPRSFAVDLQDEDESSSRYWLALAIAARRHGLKTGILWGLPESTRRQISSAIAAGHPEGIASVGWDPCHLEPETMTLEEASQIAMCDPGKPVIR